MLRKISTSTKMALGVGVGILVGSIFGPISIVFGVPFVIVVTKIFEKEELKKNMEPLMRTTDVEEIKEKGNRVLQGEKQGIKLENFDTFEEFEQALDDLELNPELTKEISEKDKETAGLAFFMKELELELDFNIDAIAKLVLENPELVDKNKLKNLITRIKEKGYSSEDVMRLYEIKSDNRELDELENMINGCREDE